MGDDLGDQEILCGNDKKLINETNEKLEKILWKLLEPNFKIKNDLYLNLLVTHWAGKTENGHYRTNLNRNHNELFFQWTIAATNWWEESKTPPSTAMLIFATNVTCQLSTDESFFNRMKSENIHEKLAGVMQVNPDTETNITVSFIHMLSSVLEHASGIQWLLTTSYWNDVIDVSLKGHNKYTRKKAYQFVIKLLETTVLLDKDFCEELAEILVEPLNKAAVQVEFTKESEVENRKLYESLKPTIDLILEIADTLLKSFNKTVLNIFLDMETPEVIQNILNYSQILDFSFDLLKIRFTFLFYQLCGKLEGIRQATHDADTLSDIRVIFSLIEAEIEKDHVRTVIKICNFANLLYCSLDTRVPLCIRKGESIEFQNQMMLFLIFPVMVLCHQFIGTSKSAQLLLYDELRQDFYIKLSKISAIKTLEMTFRWQQRLLSRRDLIDEATISLQHILKSKKIITREQAAFIFKPLIYSLKDVVWRLEVFRERTMPISGIKFFNVVIDLIIDLVETFDLTWKDSLETISVLDLACEVVQYDYVDYQVTVKFLQLLDTAISRCMSPNLVLLIESTSDSVISQIGNLMYSKCHNPSPEIRIHGMKVIKTLAINAQTKFPEFTNILLAADLPQLMVKMAMSDKDHVVKSRALKCMQQFIMLDNIWDVYQYDDNFWDNILSILINEPRGTVRKEAAMVVYFIYSNRSFPNDVLPRVYDIMTHAAIGDINWEVKNNALSFWACTLKHHLQAQGMVDYRFPSHTFSKEKRKIVTLTKEEVNRRVKKVLNQLSDIGCLYVLKTALEDKFDEEVSKTALKIATHLVRMYNHHKITWDNVDMSQPPSPFSSMSSPSSTSSDSQSSPERQFNLMNSSFPNSPCFTESLGPSPYPATPESTSVSSSEYSAAPTPSTQYADDSSDTEPTNREKQIKISNEEVENIDFFNTACKESDIVMLESDADFVQDVAENMANTSINYIEDTEKMFEELLKLNDATLLEEICNSGYQVKTPEIKTRQYIPPSEYVKICFEVVENEQKKKESFLEDLDEFDSVLDDLLKEYDLNPTT